MLIEVLIDAVAELEECLKRLNEVYVRFEKIIKDEHKFISDRSYDELEDLIILKEKAAQDIVNDCERLQKLSMKLAKGKVLSVSHLWEWLNEQLQVLSPSTSAFQRQVFEFGLIKLKKTHDLFQTRYRSLKPLVEQNAYIIGALIKRRNEQLAFWNEMRQISEGNYSQDGEVKQIKQFSVLQVKV